MSRGNIERAILLSLEIRYKRRKTEYFNTILNNCCKEAILIINIDENKEWEGLFKVLKRNKDKWDLKQKRS